MTQSDRAGCVMIDPAPLPVPIPAIIPPAPPLSPQPSRFRSRLLVAGVGAMVLAGLTWGLWSGISKRAWRGEDPTLHFPKSTVAKVDLSKVLTAPGRVESSNNTIITCELERLEIRNAGRSMSSGGASSILTLVDEGTQVKAGDIICTLDSSEYEELVRTQEIKTQQAAAALRQAQLNFEVAEISVREYQLGLYTQNIQSMEGSISLAQSNLERAIDRFDWTKQMLAKGYVAVAQKAISQRTLDECVFDLQTSRYNLSNFREYGNPMSLMELATEVEKRRYEVIANTMRVTRNNDQLANYKRMVEKCTIRAPHDGFLIYAIDPTRQGAPPIEPGMMVRQAQKLFFLPDLSKMEVVAYVHESVARQVHEGMRATARIEGLSNRILEGHVISMAPLPTTGGNWWSDEVKYFVGVVKLDSVPIGIRPGMSAEVEFDVDRCLDVLAVPCEAVAVEQGHNVCYVAGVDGLERRRVTLGRSNRDYLEVTKGLAEGDQVVLRPEKIDDLNALVVNSDKDNAADADSSAEPTGSTASPITVE